MNFMSRIDDHHTAFDYRTGEGFSNVVLRDAESVVEQSWPELMSMDFAQGRGGLGMSGIEETIYRIIGTQTEPLFTYDVETAFPYCILAADAE